MLRTAHEVLWWHIDGIANVLDELQCDGFTFRIEAGMWYWENRNLHRIGDGGYATLGMALRDAFVECYVKSFQD